MDPAHHERTGEKLSQTAFLLHVLRNWGHYGVALALATLALALARATQSAPSATFAATRPPPPP